MKRKHSRGFTLVEMAFVLLIIGLLTKTAIGPLDRLREHGKRERAEQQLQQIKDTIFAHLVAYGALPCPLAANSSGMQSSAPARQGDTGSESVCRVSTGVVPAHELGLAGAVSEAGALLDPWGGEYQFTVSLENHEELGSPVRPDWTSAGEAANVGIRNLSSDITLCNTSTGNNCSGVAIRSNQIAFVVLSAGLDNSTQGLQAENRDNDNFFIVTDESVVDGAQFDDLLVWGSAADVMYWMLRMGWLP